MNVLRDIRDAILDLFDPGIPIKYRWAKIVAVLVGAVVSGFSISAAIILLWGAL